MPWSDPTEFMKTIHVSVLDWLCIKHQATFTVNLGKFVADEVKVKETYSRRTVLYCTVL